MHDATHWDERYGQKEMVWSVEPNVWVAQVCADLAPGRALDLAAGEGRNGLWLADLGWRVTAVDFSQVGLDRARALAAGRLGEAAQRLSTVCADLETYVPEARGFDLVLLVYLQVPPSLRTHVVRTAAEAVSPGGLLLVVAHDSENLEHGHGGPQDPSVLYTAEDAVGDLAGTDLVAERAERVVRRVETDEGVREALDALVLARRPSS